MKLERAIAPEIRDKQTRASHPEANVWVSANAGSGKTHVLAHRVIWLLLKGVPAGKILCLTFTKAAAANMSARVFEILARWTTLSDLELASAIEKIGPLFEPGLLVKARRLFSTTLESPGGLKIQTIHGFCESLLHSFPFEANVPSGFKVIDDQMRAALLALARDDMLERAADDADLKSALETLAETVSAEGFEKLVNDMLSRRALFAGMEKFVKDWPRGYRAAYGKYLGLLPGEDRACLDRRIVEGLSDAELTELSACLDNGSVNDQKLGAQFRSLRERASGDRAVDHLNIFFSADGGRRGGMNRHRVTNGIKEKYPVLAEKIATEGDRLEPLLDKGRALATLERSQALMTVTAEIFKRYAHRKNTDVTLDFDDLIERTLRLLTRESAQWVLYKLDAGIEHILIDEAQDTSRRQWEILRVLDSEFSSGLGQVENLRTFFAVGDEKQSIFSFQGAEPDLFNQQRLALKAKSQNAQARFEDIRLELSFRSAPGILDAIDCVFADEENRRGLSSDDIKLVHSAWKTELPSLLEMWEPVGPSPTMDEDDWELPQQSGDRREPEGILADRIANLIVRLLHAESSEHVFDDRINAWRPVAPGDILILIRRRNLLFESLIRCLKQAGVPVAGADRMKLKNHLAVMDLVAVGRFCLLPEDDLSLACALKSPLLGLDDGDLLQIAPQRTGMLFDALAQSPVAAHQEAVRKLAEWRQQAKSLGPFQFYSGLLDAQGGRASFLARLGPEAGDALDEFLRLALVRESIQAPSLVAFLQDLETGEVEVKRDMEASSEFVRVMTVHAAKGLESKIVILPETCQIPAESSESPLLKVPGPGGEPFIVWSPRKELDCRALTSAKESRRLACLDEYRRLLYVAMTRAEERLYIMGHHGGKKPPDECWHRMICKTIANRFEAAPAFWNADERVWRLRTEGSGPPALPQSGMAQPDAEPADLPAWLFSPLKASMTPRAVRPSRVTPTRDDAGAHAFALEYGRAMHLLLEVLPGRRTDTRGKVAQTLLRQRYASLGAKSHAMLIGQVLLTLDEPRLATLFGEGSLAEAPIMGSVQVGPDAFRQINGRLDRLVECENEILFGDFKSGQPDASGHDAEHIRQLALYAAALHGASPGKSIRALLVWVAGPTIVEYSGAQLMAFLSGSPDPYFPP